MNQLRDAFSRWDRQRKLSRYRNNVKRLNELDEALGGIDPDMHPHDWSALAAVCNQLEAKCDRQAEALGLRPKE